MGKDNTRYFVIKRRYFGTGTVPLQPSSDHKPHVVTKDLLYPSGLSANVIWHFMASTPPIPSLQTSYHLIEVYRSSYDEYDQATAMMGRLFGADPSTCTPILQNMMGRLEGEKGVVIMDPTLERVEKGEIRYGTEEVEVIWYNIVGVDMDVVENNKGPDEEDGAELEKVDWMLKMAQGK